MSTNTTRILLSESASKHLTDHGADAFVVVGRGSHPDSTGRWVIYLLPCSVKDADAAVRVALGISTERKRKTDTVNDLPAKPPQASQAAP